jgi:hypothetical protein
MKAGKNGQAHLRVAKPRANRGCLGGCVSSNQRRLFPPPLPPPPPTHTQTHIHTRNKHSAIAAQSTNVLVRTAENGREGVVGHPSRLTMRRCTAVPSRANVLLCWRRKDRESFRVVL